MGPREYSLRWSPNSSSSAGRPDVDDAGIAEDDAGSDDDAAGKAPTTGRCIIGWPRCPLIFRQRRLRKNSAP